MGNGCQKKFSIFAVLVASVFISLTLPKELVAATAKVKVPFSFAKGYNLYKQHCASCHGVTLDGSTSGPPLLHPFYKPSHHGDSAFYRAALKGVQAHHWKFGNMPPVKGITTKDMDKIIPFIRWYQKEKGLF